MCIRDRAFPSNHKLQGHKMNVHLKLRPYKCRYGCELAYNDSSNRCAHEKRVHGRIFREENWRKITNHFKKKGELNHWARNTNILTMRLKCLKWETSIMGVWGGINSRDQSSFSFWTLFLLTLYERGMIKDSSKRVLYIPRFLDFVNSIPLDILRFRAEPWLN